MTVYIPISPRTVSLITSALFLPSEMMSYLSPGSRTVSPLSHCTVMASLDTEQTNSAFSPSSTSRFCGLVRNSAASSERKYFCRYRYYFLLVNGLNQVVYYYWLFKLLIFFPGYKPMKVALLPCTVSFPVVLELGSLQVYLAASSGWALCITRILFLPSEMCSNLPPSGTSSSPLSQVTSALGFETSHINFTVSPSFTSRSGRFFVKTASSSAKNNLGRWLKPA